jgi:hypothetical protein
MSEKLSIFINVFLYTHAYIKKVNAQFYEMKITLLLQSQ